MPRPGRPKVAVVTQAGVKVGAATGGNQRIFVIGDGEQAKSLASVEELCRGFARSA